MRRLQRQMCIRDSLVGSLIKKGVHNPIEPARQNCAILTGQYLYNMNNRISLINTSLTA